MKKRKKKTGSRRGMQWVTLCISTAMVLVLLGVIVFSVQTSRNLSAWVKENLTVTVMLGDDVSVNEAKRLCRDLYHRPYARQQGAGPERADAGHGFRPLRISRG